jgi:hypothetical protein
MFGKNAKLADGLAIILLRIRDAEARERIIHELCNIGEQVGTLSYEVNTADWDPGLWDDLLRRFEDVLQGTDGRLLIWKFSGQTYTRFTIRGT